MNERLYSSIDSAISTRTRVGCFDVLPCQQHSAFGWDAYQPKNWNLRLHALRGKP